MISIQIFVGLLCLFVAVPGVACNKSGDPSSCPITNSTTVVYSTVNGVGPASLIWVQDLLWWWKQGDSSVDYLDLTAADFQVCDLQSYPNLKIYINPGGDAYDQLSALGPVGTQNSSFPTRPKS